MDTETPHISVILIHGIGDLERLDVLRSTEDAIRMLLPDAESSCCEQNLTPDSESQSSVNIDAVNLSSRQAKITLVEFHWAGMIGKIRLVHPIQSLAMFFGIFREAPMLGALSCNNRHIQYASIFIANWLFWTALTFPLIGIAALIEEGLYYVSEERHQFLGGFLRDLILPHVLQTVAFEYFWYIFFITILIFTFVASTWIAFELQKLGGSSKASNNAYVIHYRVVTICVALWVLLSTAFILFISTAYHATRIALEYVFPRFIGQLDFFTGPGVRLAEVNFTETLYAFSPNMIGLAIAVWLSIFVGNLIRDVVHYLAPCADGTSKPHQILIQEQLWKLIHQVQSVHPSRLILVSHSLGTVILLDTLLKNANSDADSIPELFIVTAGSPIRRLILRLIPNRLMNIPEMFERLTKASAFRIRGWINTYRIFDYVGQALTYSAIPGDMFATRRKLKRGCEWFQECPLEPRFRIPICHSNYWGDSRFVGLIAKNLIAPYAQPIIPPDLAHKTAQGW